MTRSVTHRSHPPAAEAARSPGLRRRRLAVLLGAGAAWAAVPPLAAAAFPPGSDVSGDIPPLVFSMVRSSDGRRVTEADMSGKVVVLYFGFIRCPDLCSLTLYNLAEILRRMGTLAPAMRVLFVTIDPVHDTLSRLKSYLAKFGPPPEIDGLRGPSAELAALARRYFVQYQVPSGPKSTDPVSTITHTSFVYVFGPHGRARDLLASAGSPGVDVAGLVEGFVRLAQVARGS